MSGTHPDRNHLYNCKVAQKILLALLFTIYYDQKCTGHVIVIRKAFILVTRLTQTLLHIRCLMAMIAELNPANVLIGKSQSSF